MAIWCGVVISWGRNSAEDWSIILNVEVRLIKGLHTSKIELTLGHKYCDEIIHRDNLVVWNEDE